MMATTHGDEPGARKDDHKTDITYRRTRKSTIIEWNQSATRRVKKEGKE